jgi:hypothetical protein
MRHFLLKKRRILIDFFIKYIKIDKYIKNLLLSLQTDNVPAKVFTPNVFLQSYQAKGNRT